MFDPPERTLKLSMFAPWQARCGIRDYTAHLVKALDQCPEIESTRIVPAPVSAPSVGIIDTLLRHREDAARFDRLGHAMNAAADVAHIQHQYFLFGGVNPAKTHIRSFLNALTVPAVMTVHEIAESHGGLLNGLAIGAANRINFLHPAVHALIVHTEADRDRLVRLGQLERRIHIVRHPVPPALPMPEPQAALSRMSAVHPELHGRCVITLFGFLSVKKGHLIALAALARLPDDIAMLFAGDRHPDDHTTYFESLLAEIARLGLEHRTVVTGFVPDAYVPEIMAITDVAIAPFLHSSGSGSLANLLAYGRAIVASDIAPHKELLNEAPGTLDLVPSRDAVSLASEITALLGDSQRREALQRAARSYAASHSYTTIARATVAIYDRVLNRETMNKQR